MAAVSDLQLSVDAADRSRLRATAAEDSDLKRLQVYNPDGELPVAWRPIKYRRRALATTEHERETEERQQRKRRVVQVLEVLREAKLPFAATVASVDDVTSAVLARCCQGLAVNTLAKRLRTGTSFGATWCSGELFRLTLEEKRVFSTTSVSAPWSRPPSRVLLTWFWPCASWSWQEKFGWRRSCTGWPRSPTRSRKLP